MLHVGSFFTLITVWYKASRPFTLTASIVPILVGSALAFQEEKANLYLFILVLVGSILVQVGANLVDEYADQRLPGARNKFPAPHKVIARGLLSEGAVKKGALASFLGAIAIGIYLVGVTGWPLLVICLASLVVSYCYAAGPRPLGTIALGQPLVFLFMGPVMVLGTYYVHTHYITYSALLLSVPVGCMVTAILVANDLRDLEEDLTEGKNTLVTLFGLVTGQYLWVLLVIVSFCLSIILATIVELGLTVLITLLALPYAFRAFQIIWRNRDRSSFAIALHKSASLHWWFGLFLTVGVGLGRFY